MKPLRLGVVGFGRLAHGYYVPALRRLPEARVVAVADPLAESREQAGSRWPDALRFETLAGLLGEVELDALLVASPPSTHLAAWRAASTAGVPVFMEKPLLLAEELPLLDGREDRVRLMVDFNRRFWPTYARVRDLVAEGTLGTPLQLDFRLHLDVLGWSTITRHRLAAEDGGIAHDLGSHAIDLATWILGEPIGISAFASTERWPDDRLRLKLGFADDSSATVDLAYAERTRERLEIRGPNGRLWLEEPNRALHVETGDGSPPGLAALALDAAMLAYRGLRRSRSVGRASIHGALAAFIAGVRSGAPFTPGAKEGLVNAARLAAVARSAVAGGEEVVL